MAGEEGIMIYKTVIRTTGEKFIYSIEAKSELHAKDLAHDLNVFFASQGLNFVASVESTDF